GQVIAATLGAESEISFADIILIQDVLLIRPLPAKFHQVGASDPGPTRVEVVFLPGNSILTVPKRTEISRNSEIQRCSRTSSTRIGNVRAKLGDPWEAVRAGVVNHGAVVGKIEVRREV